jgi:hypothetical protein
MMSFWEHLALALVLIYSSKTRHRMKEEQENGHKSNKGRMRKKCGKIIIAVVFTRCFRVKIFSLLKLELEIEISTSKDLFGALRFYVGYSYSSAYLY